MVVNVMPFQQIRDVLHTIAISPDTETCVNLILQTALEITGAAGAAFYSFNEPIIAMVLGEAPDLGVHLFVNRSDDFVLLASSPKMALCPLRAGGKQIGMLALVGDSLTEADGDPLSSLVDALHIIVARAHAQEQYKALTLSQHEYIRIVSHDIRTPLTSMRGYAEMLGLRGELNDPQKQAVERIQAGVTHVAELVDNIQDAGSFDPETGFYVMKRSPLSLRDVVSPIIQRPLPPEKQALTFAMSIGADVPIINADSHMLKRAIGNLVDNAVKYTPDGGKIEVLGFVRDGSLVIGVRDNGFGISPENQKTIFERGTRIDRSEHRKVKGSGLGLFIVQSVARRHGGDAWIESELGKGSTFFFNIPLSGENLLSND
jgi:signal transduction histidine kinase